MYLLFRISANDNRMFILKMIYMIIFLHALNIQEPKVSINNVPDPGFLFLFFELPDPGFLFSGTTKSGLKTQGN